MTVLHAGGKFNHSNYKVSGGLHGVGVSVVNALSDGSSSRSSARARSGTRSTAAAIPATGLDAIGVTDKTGTKVTFHPDPEIFKGTEFCFEMLSQRLRELAYLNQGLAINLEDERTGKTHEFHFEGGIAQFVADLSTAKTVVHDKPVVIEGEVEGTQVEIALQWNDSFQETIFCFTNNIKNKDGGTHLTGFRAALTRTVNAYAQGSSLLKDLKAGLGGDDISEGLIAVVSIKHPDPKFCNQPKDKLVSQRGQGHRRARGERAPRPLPRGAPQRGQADHREGGARGPRARGGPQGARAGAAQGRARLLLAARQARRLPGARPGAQRALHRRGRQRRWLGQAGPQPQGSGDAAAARARSSTSRRPASTRCSSSQEIATLITALGCGVEKEKEIDKLRYHRIIIMTDADVDGSHIRTLLLTFFYRQFPELLERGYLYIAQPPLYQVKKGKKELYLKNEQALEDFLVESATENLHAATSAADEPVTGDKLRQLSRQAGRYKRLLEGHRSQAATRASSTPS